MTAMKPSSDDPQAPFGSNADGSPIAPYGLKMDGTPRRSPGGRQARGGPAAPRAPRPRAAGRPVETRREGLGPDKQKAALVSLADSFLTTGMVMLSQTPMVRAAIGDRHAYGLCGDAVIVNAYVPPVADGLVALAEVRPGILAWLESAAEKAPYLLLAQSLAEMTGAIIANHRAPRQDLYEAGQLLLQVNMSKMAQAVAEEAAAAGFEPIPQDPPAENEAA